MFQCNLFHDQGVFAAFTTASYNSKQAKASC